MRLPLAVVRRVPAAGRGRPGAHPVDLHETAYRPEPRSRARGEEQVMIRAIEHIAIAAADTAGLARWYRDVLGFRVVVEGTPGGIWFVGPPEGAAVVEIVPANEAPR